MFQQVMALQNSPTYRRTLAERLERERMAKNNGTIPGGLASMIDAGTAAYLRMRDEGDRSKSQEALVGGLTKGGEWGTADGQQPNAPRMEPGIGAAKHNLAQLKDNPYAGRLTQMLVFEEMARQQEAAARAQQFQQLLYRDQMNNDARMRAAAAGRSSVNVNTGNSGPQFGSIPTGYMMQQTEEGWRQVPVPGGPAAQEIEAAERARGEARSAKEAGASNVLSAIDRARQIVGDASIPVTGMGSLLSGVPGTPAHDLANTLNTIKANVGFDKLQAMRDASPTGGALGAVSEFENRLLQSGIAALEQSQTQDQFLNNLQRVEQLYSRIIHEGIPDPGDIGNGIRSMPQSNQPPQDDGPVDYIFNPATGKVERAR